MDLNNFLNDFKNEQDNREEIDGKKESIFDSIITNLITSLNEDNKHSKWLHIIAPDKLEGITVTIGDFIHSHTYSECEELLDADKCWKFLTKQNHKILPSSFKRSVTTKIDAFTIDKNIYGVPTLDKYIKEFARDRVNTIVEKESGIRSIYTPDNLTKIQMNEDSDVLQWLHPDLVEQIRNKTTDRYSSNNTLGPTITWDINTLNEPMPYTYTSQLKYTSPYTSLNTDPNEPSWLKNSRWARLPFETDEEYRSRLRRQYGFGE